MKKKLKSQIKYLYLAPSPLQKEEFLGNLNFPKTRWYDFLYSQFGYIRKKVWIFSMILFTTVLLLTSLLQSGDRKLLWAVSSMLPFLALLTVTETARSAAFGLAELELTTRYSLKSILLARMGLLGAGNLVLLMMTMPILAGKESMGYFKTGVYLIVPYLLTSFLSFALVNHVRSREYSYFCAAVAAAVSTGGLLFGQLWNVIYQQQYFILWLVITVILSVALAKEINRLIKNSEDLIWNS